MLMLKDSESSPVESKLAHRAAKTKRSLDERLRFAGMVLVF